MKTKITIINVDLGVAVQDLIDKEVEVFTGETKKLVDKMLEQQRHVATTKRQIEDDKRKLVDILETIYEDLDKAGDEGLPVQEVWERAKEAVKTPSAFTLKMKNMMVERQSKKLFVRTKINKIERYVFK
jgi:hypothetical protein